MAKKQFTAKSLIGKTKEAAEKLAEKNGFTLSEQVSNLRYVKTRIQVEIKDGKITSARVG